MTAELPDTTTGATNGSIPTAVSDELARLLDTWSSALLARSKVTDDLLDLRSLLAPHPLAQSRVDKALGTLPGQNLVAREWAVAVVTDVADTFGFVSQH